MPDSSTLLLFAAAALALILVPGPAVLYIVAQSLASHRLRGSRRFLTVQRWVSGSVFVGLGAVTALAKRH